MFDLQKTFQRLRGRITPPEALVAAIAAVWVVGYALPRMSNLAAVSEDLGRADRLAVERSELIENRDEIIAAFKGLTERSEASGGPREDATGVMRTLNACASGAGVRIMQMHPGRVEMVGGVRRVGADAELKGRLEALVRYIYEIENGPEALSVTYLNLRVPIDEDGKGELEARMSAVAHLP